MRECLDPSVSMDPVKHVASDRGDGVKIQEGTGLLSALDPGGTSLDAHRCPECGLAQLYADV